MMKEIRDAVRQVLSGAALLALLAAPALGEDQGPANDKPAADKAAAPAMPQNVEVLPAGVASGILGKKIRDVSGVDMGMVTDVLVDRGGMPVAAVIDFGGFLGVGSRKIAIDWMLLQFNPGDDKGGIVLSLDRTQIQAAPEYKPGAKLVQMVGPPAAEGASSEPTKSE
jgi:hypothetical protein